MRTRTETSRSLWFFQVARLMAEILEETKKGCLSDDEGRRAEAKRLCAGCEDVVDRAWEMAREIEESGDASAARIITDHFLLGKPWVDTAVAEGRTVYACKKAAATALRRQDERRAARLSLTHTEGNESKEGGDGAD